MYMLLLFVLTIAVNLANCSDPEKELRGKVVIVTGAAQGIGYAIADNFLKHDVKLIIILDVKEKEGTKVAKEFNNVYGEGKAVYIKCDVTKDLDKVPEYILEKYGYVDVLVNDAGILDEYETKETIANNTIALMEWSLKFREQMRKDKGGRGGTILNLSSIIGYYIQPFMVNYAASKYAVLGFTKTLGHVYNYRNTAVRVLAICPGFTYTAMTAQQMVWDEQLEDFNRLRTKVTWQSADDVGRGAVQVFETAESGTAWEISGGDPPVEAPTNVTLTLEYILSD